MGSMASARSVLSAYSKSNAVIFKFFRSNLLKPKFSNQLCFLERLKSTSASVGSEDTSLTKDQEKFQKDELDLTFGNAKDAYKSKTTWELVRALLVLKLSTIDYLIENNQKLMKLGKKILGNTLFNFLMKNTFYGHFVAGENEQVIFPVIKRMQSFGVKSILDYSAEEDISEEQAKECEMSGLSSKSKNRKVGQMKQYQPYERFADRRKHHTVARTYFYQNEAQCEKNMEVFLKCINAVAGTTQSTGFAAIKITALGRPQVLMQLSEIVAVARIFFKTVVGPEKDIVIDHITPQFLEQKLEDYNIRTKQKDVQVFSEDMDFDEKGLMNLFHWSGLVNLDYEISDIFKIPNMKTGKMEPLVPTLTGEEEEMFHNMMRRLNHIARVAEETDVRVMIDAEQSYFQPAISRITMELMRKYNKEKAIIFNTYQCYLKEAYNNIVIDLELAERQNLYFGAKLVRGAYMEQERIRAADIGYEDPINPTYEATSEMYHKSLSELLRRIVKKGDRKIAAMVASHNEDTVRFTVKKMQEMKIKPEHKVVCFGQLYGMCDQVSFLLGQSGYSVYKYVPYGPISEVIPYLTRRAQENNGLLKKSDRERKLLFKEIRQRILSGRIFVTPVGNYRPI